MMNDLPTIAKCNINGFIIEVCSGNIPDIFRLLRFGPLVEPELPDTKEVNQGGFLEWMDHYRHAHPFSEYLLLEDARHG
jgi:hypothetical protein